MRGFEVVADKYRKHPNVDIQLPTRATQHSAGYDFYSPVTAVINPNEQVIIWTDVKAYMQPDEVLLILPRSSIGIKRGLILANTIGVIDSDYYNNPENDGNIAICLKNLNPHQTVVIEKGEKIAQGIFVKYLLVDNDNTTVKRKGGIGSTNQK